MTSAPSDEEVDSGTKAKESEQPMEVDGDEGSGEGDGEEEEEEYEIEAILDAKKGSFPSVRFRLHQKLVLQLKCGERHLIGKNGLLC